MDYEKQAEQFAVKHNVKMVVKFLKNDFYFTGDEKRRHIYEITLNRNDEQYIFTFGQSYNCSENNIEPTLYDVLACLTKSDPGSYDDFLSEYGYKKSKDSIRTYNKVKDEYKNVMRLFDDIIDELVEII